MCRHCEHLVEDVAHKQVIHDFMAVLTAGINRKLTEQGMTTRVTVDEVEFYANVPNKEKRLPPELSPSVLKLLYRDLMDSVK